MKTPDEIKKGQEQCVASKSCHGCPYEDDCYENFSNVPMIKETFAYIQQLEAELEAVKRERNALMLDFQTCVKRTRKVCSVCSNKGKPICNMCERCDVFEWRGVCPENTKEDK